MQTFDRKGYHATTVDDVVKTAKTSRGTFYLYFSNKDDLLNTLAHNVAEEAQELVGGLAEVTPDPAGYVVLRNWLDRFSGLYAHYGPVIRAWQEAENSEAFAELGITVLTDFTEALVAHLSDGLEATQINPHIAALAFVSMVERFNFLLASRRVSVERGEMLDTLATIVHKGFFGGGRTSARTSARPIGVYAVRRVQHAVVLLTAAVRNLRAQAWGDG